MSHVIIKQRYVWLDLCVKAHLMHCFPEDVFVFFLVDVFALIVRLDRQLDLLYCPLLCMQLLQVLCNSGKTHVK